MIGVTCVFCFREALVSEAFCSDAMSFGESGLKTWGGVASFGMLTGVSRTAVEFFSQLSDSESV